VFLNAQENALDFIVKTADSMNSYQQYKISETEILTYKKPKIWDAVNKIIPNAKGTIKDIVSKKYYPYGLASLGATLVFIPMDPWFISESRNFGESLGLNEDHNYKKLGILKIIPADIGAAMYFIGNGTVVILISAGFGTYGLLKNDFRAQSTSLQLLESIAQSGLFAQSIKRITGRESPFITDRAGREHSYWQFMPSFSAYQKHTSNYDAMPSGHLTTAVAALTVITENYPEKVWIKPVGYTLLGLMCFEMLQSKVHWVSDYPIAIFLGYLIGKNISKSRIIKAQNSENTHNISKINFKISASKWNEYQTLGINISF
jgi:membrane-associated phospholipid phosphatase